MAQLNRSRLAVRKRGFLIRTCAPTKTGNVWIEAKQRVTDRGRTRLEKVWGALTPQDLDELLGGLGRQYVGGVRVRQPMQYRRILRHGDLRVKIRGTQRTGFGIVIYDKGLGGASVAGHLKLDQFLKLHNALVRDKDAVKRWYARRARSRASKTSTRK